LLKKEGGKNAILKMKREETGKMPFGEFSFGGPKLILLSR
jgi:hypothetical protein